MDKTSQKKKYIGKYETDGFNNNTFLNKQCIFPCLNICEIVGLCALISGICNRITLTLNNLQWLRVFFPAKLQVKLCNDDWCHFRA